MGKMVGINLLIFLVYASWVSMVAKYEEATIPLFGMLCIIHIISCLSASLNNFAINKKNNGIGLLISALLIAIIGTGTCFTLISS